MVAAIGSVAASTTQRSAARRPALPRRTIADDGAGDAAEAEREHQFGQLQGEQRRHVAARHVGDEDQFAAEQFLPRLLEERGKIIDGEEWIERRVDAPRPDEAHHQVGEDETRDEGVEDKSAFGGGRAQTACACLGGDDEEKRHERIDHGEAAHDTRADREAEPDTGERDGRRRNARVFLECAHEAEQRNRHGDRERAVLGVDEHVAVIERAGGEQE